MLAASLTSVSAQTVSFRNNDVYATTAERRVFGAECFPLVGTQYAAQLLYGSSASSLIPHTQTATFRNVATSDALAGTWIGGTRTLTGMPFGQTAILQVRVWDTTSGAAFETALRRSLSSTFTYVIPTTSAPPPPNAFFMEGLRSFGCIPEPSGIGLALLGASAVLILIRRGSL